MDTTYRTAIVTGASRGVGRATALTLTRHGIRVLAVARQKDLLDQLAREAQTYSGSVLSFQADVTVKSQVEAAVKAAMDTYGRIDILINNAGVEMVKPLDQLSDRDLEATLGVNLTAVIFFTRAVIPVMIAQGAGLIINISSTAGQRGFAEDAAYCAAKFGVVGFSDALNEELRKFGIGVCCISPGAINTDLAKNSWSPPDDPYRPFFLQADDVARVIQFVVDQPANVVVESIVMRPFVEPPYSPPLPLDTLQDKKSPGK